MDDLYLIVSSSTTANKMKRFALREGIRGLRVVQAPKSVGEGCRYALRCPRTRFADVTRLADAYGVRIERVYESRRTETGETTYALLPD